MEHVIKDGKGKERILAFVKRIEDDPLPFDLAETDTPYSDNLQKFALTPYPSLFLVFLSRISLSYFSLVFRLISNSEHVQALILSNARGF
jgi:hypothetical protein